MTSRIPHDPSAMVGKMCVKGTRFGLYFLLDMTAAGEMSEHLPGQLWKSRTGLAWGQHT